MMQRRKALRALLAAPFAAKAAAETAITSEAGQLAGLSLADPSAPVPFGGYGIHILEQPALFAALKAGVLPRWAQREVERSLQDAGRFMSPDVAAMRSVSLSGKCAIHRQRLERRHAQTIVERVEDMIAQQMFWRNGGR